MPSSVPPPFVMSILHLRLKEASKDSFARPAHAISLLYSTLNNDFAVRDDVNVDPDAVS